MNTEKLLKQAEVLAVERRPEACLGCGFEHSCSLHGCAVINKLVETVRTQKDRIAAYEATGLQPEDITQTPGFCAFYSNRMCNLDGDWCSEGPGCPNEISCCTAKAFLKSNRVDKEPLTLEELDFMRGEAVWVEPPGARELGRWAIVEGADDKSLFLKDDFTCHGYGVCWLAYRRRPEEGK